MCFPDRTCRKARKAALKEKYAAMKEAGDSK
jgi:hypothetical protein